MHAPGGFISRPVRTMRGWMRRNPPSVQDLLREFAQLNGRRKGSGITPLEFQRWLDLRSKLEKAFPGRPPPDGGRTRVLVEFESRVALSQSIMANVRPIGLFVPTPFAAEPGTKFELRVQIVETSETYDSPVVVVSNNVGPEFSTQNLGMGVRFTTSRGELHQVLDELWD